MKKLALILMLAALFSAGACNSKTGKTIKTAPAGNNLSVSLATKDGVLKHGNTEFTLSFADASGKYIPYNLNPASVTFNGVTYDPASCPGATTWRSANSPGSPPPNY